MNGLISWFAENRVAANLLMVLIAVAGLLSLSFIRQETFPKLKLDMVSISVEYPGASPDEVEEAICVRIEESIHSVQGVKRIRSVASEGFATVTAEVDVSADAARVLSRIKLKVDAIDTFPQDAERPVIQELDTDNRVIGVAVSGHADVRSLRALAEQLRDELSDLSSVRRVELLNARPYEISIEVSERALRRHGIAFEDVARAVRTTSVDLPGGSVKSSAGEILVRTKGQVYRGEEFEDLILISGADGARLRLGDVARVNDGFKDTGQSVRLDGKPAVLVQVYATGEGSVIETARQVRDHLDRVRPRVPEGIQLTAFRDESTQLESRRNLLLRNGRDGLFMVVAILGLFLNIRLATWVSVGIVVAFLGALAAMPSLDVSVNMMSLFAFIVALGLVVDDAIVIAESIDRNQANDDDMTRAAIRGTREVAVPVLIAALTSVAFLLPVALIPGGMGKLAIAFPLIVTACLVFSLIESLLILPAHLSHRRRQARAPGVLARWDRLQSAFASRFQSLIRTRYRPLLVLALRQRFITVSLAVSILALTLAAVAGGWVRYAFFPEVEDIYATALLTMPYGSSAESTDRGLRHLEDRALALSRELQAEQTDGGSLVRHVLTFVGSQPEQALLRPFEPVFHQFEGGHLGEVELELIPRNQRTLSTAEVASRWREESGSIPDALELIYTVSAMPASDPVAVQLVGHDPHTMRSAARALRLQLARLPGVRDARDSSRGGKEQVTLRIRPEAQSVGLSVAELARQVRQGFYGDEVQRIARGRDDVPVMIRYPASQRRSLGDLERAFVRSPAGFELPLSAVATVEYGRGPSSIQRTDRKRTLNVTANVDLTVTTPGEVMSHLTDSLLPQLLADFPGIDYRVAGQQSEEDEIFASLGVGWLLALIGIYTLIAAVLRSYLQPLAILATIPFGVIGATFGHALLGVELTVFTVIGLVALAGVVVNDGLLLVDTMNRLRAEGRARIDAVVDACVVRCRAVVLTSLTTFVGLMPLLFETDAQAAWLKPMAISLGFGLLVATAITLLLVPAVYLLLDDLAEYFGSGVAKSTGETTLAHVEA